MVERRTKLVSTVCTAEPREDGASGGHLSASVSLALFLTTRSCKQMAAAFTPRHREASDDRLGGWETKL